MRLYGLLSLAWVAGLVSFTSPCALPLLPGYLAYVSGLRLPETGERLAGRERRRMVGAAALFVLGFSLVFTILGATASAVGVLLARHVTTLDAVAGLVIILMGLATAGLVRIPPLQRGLQPFLGRIRSGPAGALPLGAAFAFGWTPCVGPVLASILAAAASTTTVAQGMLLLLAYSLGLGGPFLALAAALGSGSARLGWLSRHARLIELSGGALLVVMGFAIVTGGWTELMSWLLAGYARLGWPPL